MPISKADNLEELAKEIKEKGLDQPHWLAMDYSKVEKRALACLLKEPDEGLVVLVHKTTSLGPTGELFKGLNIVVVGGAPEPLDFDIGERRFLASRKELEFQRQIMGEPRIKHDEPETDGARAVHHLRGRTGRKGSRY